MKRKEKHDRIFELRKQGKTYQEIADVMSLNKASVKKYCQKHNMGYSPEEVKVAILKSGNQFQPFVDWQERLDVAFVDKVILLDQESMNNGEWKFVVRCQQCGFEFTTTSNTIRGKKNPNRRHCPNCYEGRIKLRQADKQIEKTRLKKKKEKERLNQKLKNNQVSFKFCRCGQLLPDPSRTVCDLCKKETKREQYRKKDVKRRAKLRRVERDNSISLGKLFKRDDGLCYLCGGVCDWTDYQEINGTFIAGNSYPSVDHVIPISHGGSDTWDNIKLAHRLCNSKKRDKIA